MARLSSLAVDPLVPLELLEAVRDADRPDGAAEAEYVPELLNKRLGTTDTVYTQIRRYSEAVRRGEAIPTGEVAGLARLIARRPDAESVFREAGRAVSRSAFLTLSRPRRAMIRFLPGVLARRLARGAARRLAARYLGARLRRVGNTFTLEHVVPPAFGADTGAAGVAFYDAARHELLTLLALA